LAVLGADGIVCHQLKRSSASISGLVANNDIIMAMM
jgi:hypothetical protein